LTIPSEPAAARKAEDAVIQEVGRFGYSEAAAFAIKLALEEGLINAIKHGNRLDPCKSVELSYDVDEERVRITIVDEGPGFAPEDVPDPTADENLAKPCGRGLMLMRAYMDEVHFNPEGNRVCMVKRRSSAPGPSGLHHEEPC
jgi:serine/threonine-protein kinase RsbW